jgi:hypothetical protein
LPETAADFTASYSHDFPDILKLESGNFAATSASALESVFSIAARSLPEVRNGELQGQLDEILDVALGRVEMAYRANEKPHGASLV